MDAEWEQTFRERMHGFRNRRRPPREGDVALSIKLRVVSGCFHREHSPRAYALIDSHLGSLPPDVEFVEHESGPELLVYMAVATAGLTLAKSVIDLITAIIKARSDGAKKGDRPAEPLELIVRHVHDGREHCEEVIFRISHLKGYAAFPAAGLTVSQHHGLRRHKYETGTPISSRPAPDREQGTAKAYSNSTPAEQKRKPYLDAATCHGPRGSSSRRSTIQRLGGPVLSCCGGVAGREPHRR